MIDWTRPALNMYADLAVIGIEYVNGRMTRNDYIEAAIGLGLSSDQAHNRALAFDMMPLRVCT